MKEFIKLMLEIGFTRSGSFIDDIWRSTGYKFYKLYHNSDEYKIELVYNDPNDPNNFKWRPYMNGQILCEWLVIGNEEQVKLNNIGFKKIYQDIARDKKLNQLLDA